MSKQRQTASRLFGACPGLPSVEVRAQVRGASVETLHVVTQAGRERERTALSALMRTVTFDVGPR